MTKVKNQIATSKKEWWDQMRNMLTTWNNANHIEDNMSLQDWVGNYVGNDILGYHVEAGDTETGYVLTKLDI